jgi:apolipoprotein N-acyltransferase
MPGEFAPARSLAETQLQVEFAILGGLDTQALGILGVDVGLAALAIAARSVLERFWWMTVVGLALSGLACLVALFGSSDPIGPTVQSALAQPTADQADRYVAEQLRDAIGLNASHIARGSTVVGVAVLLLFLALIAAAISAVLIS